MLNTQGTCSAGEAQRMGHGCVLYCAGRSEAPCDPTHLPEEWLRVGVGGLCGGGGAVVVCQSVLQLVLLGLPLAPLLLLLLLLWRLGLALLERLSFPWGWKLE